MTKKYGILAYPAAHSLSPVMHNAAFKALNIDAEYGIFDIPPTELSEFMERVKHDPIDGLSVSLPYKETIIPFLHQIDDDAKNIGAVNTVINNGGFLYGYNTDFVGSVAALKTEIKDLKDKKVVIIGAGGACRAIVYGLLKEKADVTILNKTPEKAKNIADEFLKIFGKSIGSGSLEDIKNFEKGDVLIQATSIWTLNPSIPNVLENFISDENVNKFDIVMDIVYKPLITPLLKVASDLGKKIITGDKMLLYQAVEQFKLWTKKEAPVQIMREALEDQLV